MNNPNTQQPHTLPSRSRLTHQPKLVKECVCPNPKMKEENQIKTSPSLDLKKGKISLRMVRGMGATVANIVYKQ